MSIGTTPIHMEDIELANTLVILSIYELYGMPHNEFSDFVTTPYEELPLQRHLISVLITKFHLLTLHSDGRMKTDPKDFARYLLESSHLTIREQMRGSKLKDIICPYYPD